jgi:ribosome-associated protein
LRLKRDEELLARVEGGPAAGWSVLDYLDCVLHVFTPEARDRYRLEQLWEDAPRLELELAGAALEHRAARA